MPLFSFCCRSCSHQFETLVSAAETPVCPSCGSDALDRLLSSAPAVGGKSAGLLRTARAAAGREGHFSNYSRSEIRKK